MIKAKSNSSKNNYAAIVNQIFKEKKIINDINLSEDNIKQFNISFKYGHFMYLFLDPINMNLLILNKGLHTFSIKDNKYMFLGRTIFLGTLCLQNFRRNKIFKDFIDQKEVLDLSKEKISEFLESTTFKRQVLKLVDQFLKGPLINQESNNISDLYSLNILFSEASVTQKVYAYYMEYSDNDYKREYINECTFAIPNDSVLLLNARTEILNLILNQNKPSELNGFKFLLWFNKTFYNIPTDNVADIFKLTNIILKNEVENPRINNEEILSSFRIALESVSGQNSDILKYTNLSKNDKKSFMTLLKPAELKTQLQTQKISSEQIINFLKEDFIFDYRLYRELAWKFQDGYSAFYINNLVNINKNSQLIDSVNLIKVSENVTDLYLNKKEFEQFNILLSVLNLELTEYIPETTKIHFIEDDTIVLDRFI